MKVLDLQCSLLHQFEGWFASEQEFQRQLSAGLVECPLCGATAVHKRLSAPYLNLASNRDAVVVTPELPVEAGAAAKLQGKWMDSVRQMLASSEDVGDNFPEEARKMHYGEVKERSIRGQATPTQARELEEEGIPVLPISLPPALKDSLH